MHQTILARQDADEGTKVHQTDYLAFIDAAHFNIGSNEFDATLRFLTGHAIYRSNLHRTVIININAGAGFFSDRTDHCTALTDHFTDLLRINLDGNDARCPFRHGGARGRQHLVHLTQNVQATCLGLSQSYFHDFFGDAIDLDVHLQCGHAISCTGHLEIHITQMVFITQNVGQHGEAITFFHQTHGHTGNRCLQRHTGIHQCQAAAAD